VTPLVAWWLLKLNSQFVPPDRQLVDRIREREWYYGIDLRDGLVTPGNAPHPLLSSPDACPDFPAFPGRSVLDVGGSDGEYHAYR
jgi:hypothetical protein